MDQRADKQHRVADVFCIIGHMFADERIVLSQLVAQDDGFVILRQSGRLIRVHRMHGYGEIAEANRMLPSEPVKAGWIFN